MSMLRCHFSTLRIKISLNRNVTNTLNVNKLFCLESDHTEVPSHILNFLIIPTKFYSRETSPRESSANNYDFLETCLSTPPEDWSWCMAYGESRRCSYSHFNQKWKFSRSFLHFHTNKSRITLEIVKFARWKLSRNERLPHSAYELHILISHHQ